MNNAKNHILTMKEAARYKNMSYEAFRYWVKRRLEPEFIPIGTRKCFLKEVLDAWEPIDRRRKSKHA